MSKLLKYLKPYWWQILLLFTGLALQVNANLELPKLMSNIIDKGIAQQDLAYVWQQGITMLLVTLSGGLGMVIAGFFASRIGTGFSRTLRDNLFRHIISFSINEIDQFSTASLITRTTNDITQVQMTLVMVLRMSCQAPIMAIGAIISAFTTAPSMTWIIGMVIAVLLSVITVVIIFGLPKFKIIQKLNDRLNLVTRENLTGLRVVRAFNNEKYEEERFDATNEEVTRVNVFVQRLMVTMMPVVQFAMSGSVLLIIWVGASLVDTGQIAIGEVMAFVQYAMQVMMSFMFLTMAFFIVPRALVSWKRIREVLDTQVSITWSKNKKPTKARTGIEFKNVSFSYPSAESPVLTHISFTARPSCTTAIIGSTGSGKSTIPNLIPRFYDVTDGQILLNGLDIRDYGQKDLIRRLGVVPQRSVLFSGTIESNIKLGAPKASKKDVEKAAKVAQAYDFISKLEKRFDTHVAQGGTNFSGGQKQRLAIARAVAKNPEVYIFDDSFSALDYKTDLKLREALQPITKDAVVIIVAQRVGTIKNADQILVLDKGKIVGTGTHRQLLKTCPTYREIAASQLSEAEMKQELKDV